MALFNSMIKGDFNMNKLIQLMVGPTAIPQRVLNAMNVAAFSHRTKQYDDLQERVTNNLKKVFQTKNEVLVMTSSGTGSMEAVIQNCFSPGDEVVVPVMGGFSDQYARMCEAYGLNVKRVTFEYGETADVDTVMKEVTANTKGLFLTHNESSTGVSNDAEGFGKVLKDTDILFVVDSVSGLGGLEIKMDEWSIDAVLTSSQKALMSPPGLSFISLSDKAWERTKTSTFPKYYFDLNLAREFNKKNETLTTPSIYTLLAVDEALKMMEEEGFDNIYKRHKENTQIIIQGVKKLGFELFLKDERFASATLTAISTPGKSKYIVSELAKRNVIVNGGIGKYAEDFFRVGTMGYVNKNDVYTFLNALEDIVNNMK